MTTTRTDLLNLVNHKYRQEMLTDARFKATIDVALSGSTSRDVLALLVGGLAASCRDTSSIRQELVEMIKRHAVTNPQFQNGDN